MTEVAKTIPKQERTAVAGSGVHRLSAVLYAFATHPDQRARLRAEPGLARVAVDEAVRWESPLQ
jgi:cytochrome P450